MYRTYERVKAFTLIELSIVLVIIGLLVGGVLVGRDLIAAAAIRAQISQIQQYQTAVRIFQEKYSNFLPGDLPAAPAAQFGFGSRGVCSGQGNGDGVIEGRNTSGGCGASGVRESGGEVLTFWSDLSKAGLIEKQFTVAASGLYIQTVDPVKASTTPSLSDFFPESKLGAGTYVYVWSGGADTSTGFGPIGDGVNYFGLDRIGSLLIGGSFQPTYITMAQCYAIDSKIDDGKPKTGNVLAIDLRGNLSYFLAGTYNLGSGSCALSFKFK